MKPRITLLQLLLGMNWLAVIGWQVWMRGAVNVCALLAIALLCGLTAGCLGLFCRCFRKATSWAVLASFATATAILLLPVHDHNIVPVLFSVSLAGSFAAANVAAVFDRPAEEVLFLPPLLCATFVLILGIPSALVLTIWSIVDGYGGHPWHVPGHVSFSWWLRRQLAPVDSVSLAAYWG